MTITSLAPVFFTLSAGCRRPPSPRSPADAALVEDRIAAYRAEMLAPAHVPPPSIDAEALTTASGSVTAVARPVRAEDAAWNRWVDGGPRLFNNGAALLFELDIDGPPPLAWIPAETRLEVNDTSTSLAVAPSSEVLLAELLFHAYLEEEWGIDGDLLDRTRGAGPFRSAYLPGIGEGALDGVVAFPFGDTDRAVHVVALRLTVAVTAADGPHELVWVFD